MLNSKSKISASPKVWEQVQDAVKKLLEEPLPPFSLLTAQFVVHDAKIKRIKITREVQIEVQERE